MISQNIHFLTEVRGSTLDKYLAAGWYRIYDLMFTTDSITVEEEQIPVLWLRYDLQQLVYSRSSRKLLARNRKYFHLSISDAKIDAEKEDLYIRYWLANDMDMSSSISHSLFSNEPNHIFETKQLELRCEGRLIGAGYFDLGQKSAAGILNFYDPKWKKFSLGKYLMLEAIEYCLQTGRRYFYPGYIAQGWNKFDYKLTVDEQAAEVFKEQQWVKY